MGFDPNTMSNYGVMYALFEIVDNFDLKIEKISEEYSADMCITVNRSNKLYEYMQAWYELEKRTKTELEAATSDEEKNEIKQFNNSWKWNFPKAIVDETAKRLQRERIKSKIEKLKEEYEKLEEE